jgi:hypothetical protein
MEEPCSAGPAAQQTAHDSQSNPEQRYYEEVDRDTAEGIAALFRPSGAEGGQRRLRRRSRRCACGYACRRDIDRHTGGARTGAVE